MRRTWTTGLVARRRLRAVPPNHGVQRVSRSFRWPSATRLSLFSSSSSFSALLLLFPGGSHGRLEGVKSCAAAVVPSALLALSAARHSSPRFLLGQPLGQGACAGWHERRPAPSRIKITVRGPNSEHLSSSLRGCCLQRELGNCRFFFFFNIISQHLVNEEKTNSLNVYTTVVPCFLINNKA